MKTLILVAIMSFACASSSRSKQVTKASDYKAKDGTRTASKGQATPQGNIVCEDEMPLGSHIPKQVCYYQEDLDQSHQDTQDFLHANPAKNTNPGG